MGRKKPSERIPVEHALHLKAKQDTIRSLERRTHTGVDKLVHHFPELEGLMAAIENLIDRADPGQGRALDAPRGTGQTISHDGLSTAAGRSTLNDRKTLAYWRRRIAGQVEAMNNDLDPMVKRQADSRPRCQKPDCVGKGKRQAHGIKFCGYCAKPMGRKSKPKRKKQTKEDAA